MPSGWKLAAGVTVGMFTAGIAVGYVAHKRGVPQDQVGRWFVKGVTRRALRAVDAIRDLMPDAEPVAVADALGDEPLDPGVP